VIADGNNSRELPKTWTWTRLKEVCLAPQYGWTTSAAAEGTLKLLRTTDITSGRINWDKVPFCKREPADTGKYVLRDGDVVISRAGSVGYSQLIKKPVRAVFASYLIRFRPLIDEYFFAYFLKSPAYWRAISEKQLGIALPNVNASKLKEIGFPLPPLAEQKRIVARLEELFTKLDAGVEALKKIKAQLKRYRQAVLKHAFEGKLTEKWRQAHKGELEPASKLLERIKKERGVGGVTGNNNNSLELPKNWALTNLGEVSDIIRGISFPKNAKTKTSQKGYIACLRTTNVQRKVEWGDLWFVPQEFVKRDEQLVKKYDILISTANSLELVGKVCQVKTLPYPSTLGAFISLIRISPILDQTFFYFQLASAEVQSKIRSCASTTTNISNVSTRKLADIELMVPPFAEQKRIVAEIERHFSIADQIEQTIEQGLKQAQRLRQSILKKAFEGKLTEKWRQENPELVTGENSAEKLLERIKAEKTKLQAEKKARKRRTKKSRKSK